MSKWNSVHDRDIDIDEDSLEVNLYVTADDWGSVYATLTFAQVKKMYEKIELIEKR